MKTLRNLFSRVSRAKKSNNSNDIPPNYTITDEAPLLEAARDFDENGIQNSLDKGISVNASDEDGNTALHLVLSAGDKSPETLSILLESGADPNRKNHKGNTSLHRAVKYGAVNAIASLLESGADPNMLNSSHELPIQDVGMSEEHYYRYDIEALLIEAGATIPRSRRNLNDVKQFDTAFKEALDSPESSEKLGHMKTELVKSHEIKEITLNGNNGEIQQWDRFARAQSLFDNPSVKINRDNYEDVMSQFEYMSPGYGPKGHAWREKVAPEQVKSEARDIASSVSGIKIEEDKDVVSYGSTKEGNSWVNYVKEDGKKGTMIEL